MVHDNQWLDYAMARLVTQLVLLVPVVVVPILTNIHDTSLLYFQPPHQFFGHHTF